MERRVDINEISDGKKYSINDMVKISCNDCEGCSKCCENMQGLITLDPYDIHRMIKGIENSSFETLLAKNIELTLDRGILIPTLKMSEERNKCSFLNENGRCSIHNLRPGICRLFPMGRLYEDESYYYFLQSGECDYKIKTKIKLKNWLDTDEIQKYEKYIGDWHYFIRDIRNYVNQSSEEEAATVNKSILAMFYVKRYEDGFYEDFYRRLRAVKEYI